jgi:hypothetical protein
MRLPPVVIPVLSIGCDLIFWPDFHENFHQMGCNDFPSQTNSGQIRAKPEKQVFAVHEDTGCRSQRIAGI